MYFITRGDLTPLNTSVLQHIHFLLYNDALLYSVY